LYSTETPGTVTNYLSKAKSGYYNNLTFHRVESWVVQGGDPLGTGTGGGSIPTELSNRPFKLGSLGVARAGDITISNDSQFFICTEDCSWLTGKYTNFGEVISGMDVVKQITIGDKILSISVSQ
jgi:peptidyl-prolyl cis-trans isomerase B (cyclophilin B)